jgi:hypothetical protein
MIYLHTKFHMSSTNILLVIGIRPKGKYGVLEVAMLLFHILQNLCQ